MTGDLWPSAFVAAVFAIHPLRVESVAWVAERKDVLSGLFFMLTLAAYAGYVRRPFSLARYLLVVLLFALGLMAKPMLVTLPLVLLLLDYWPLGRMALPVIGRLVLEKLPLLAMSAALVLRTLWAQTAAITPLKALPLSLRVANALVSYAAYVGQLFYPAGLAVLYPLSVDSLSNREAVGRPAVPGGVTIGTAVCRRRCPWLLVGWLWYLGMLVPVIGLVQVGSQSMADRYTYLPQIGLLIGLAWGATRAIGTWPYRSWLCGVASVLVVAALMGCAWRQTSYWHDSGTLWTHTLLARNATRLPTTTSASSWCAADNSTRPSPFTKKPRRSSPITPRLTTTSAQLCKIADRPTRPSQSIGTPWQSTRITSSHTIIWALPCAGKSMLPRRSSASRRHWRFSRTM